MSLSIADALLERGRIIWWMKSLSFRVTIEDVPLHHVRLVFSTEPLDTT